MKPFGSLEPLSDQDALAEQLRFGRETAGLTQVAAARRLGLSQPYLSQLERGSRRITSKIARRALKLYGLRPTALPMPPETRRARADTLARQLAALGYPRYRHLRPVAPTNPAAVVLEFVCADDPDARLVEAVPWVLTQYPDLDWKWLVPKVKLRNVQNRLGYLVALASAVAEHEPGVSAPAAASRLTNALAELEKARLAAETTLGREGLTAAEKTWLREHRPPAARHWNVLTSLTPEQLLTRRESKEPS